MASVCLTKVRDNLLNKAVAANRLARVQLDGTIPCRAHARVAPVDRLSHVSQEIPVAGLTEICLDATVRTQLVQQGLAELTFRRVPDEDVDIAVATEERVDTAFTLRPRLLRRCE